MSRQKALWFAGLSLVVVSATAATRADAQARSERIKRRAGKQQPAAAPRTDTVTVTRSDTVRVRDTVFVDRPLPAPPPRVDTVRVAPPPPARLGYFGVVAGVALPLSHTKDGTYGNGVTTVAAASPGYNVGPSVFGFIGANARSGVLGLRLDGGYTLLRGKNVGNGYSTAPRTSNYASPDLAIYQGTLDGVIRAPFGRDSTGADHGGLYIFGGGGVAHVRSFLQSDVAPNIEINKTSGVIQGGAGLELGALGAGKIFAEGRFVYIFTPGTKITFVPVGLGVRF